MSHWLHPVLVLVEDAQVEFQAAHNPDPLAGLADPHGVTGKYGAQVDLSPPDTDASALSHAHAAVMEGILGLVR